MILLSPAIHLDDDLQSAFDAYVAERRGQYFYWLEHQIAQHLGKTGGQKSYRVLHTGWFGNMNIEYVFDNQFFNWEQWLRSRVTETRYDS